MKLKVFLLAIIACFLCSCATVTGFKSITTENIKEYIKNTPKAEEHPNAGAIALLQNTCAEMFEDGTSIVKTIERYKIFNKRGEAYASKSIRYREGYTEVTILFANTIKPDGTVVPVEKKDIKDFSPYANYAFYTDIKEKKFEMPAIEPGCIIEYCYEVKDLKPLLPYDMYFPFFCQVGIPLKEDILEVVLPKTYELNYRMFNTNIVPVVKDVGNKKRYTFKNLNQPEIVPEPRMPSILDREVYPQFVAWTLTDWNTISSWYIKLVKEQMQSDEEMETFTKALVSDKKTKEEKTKEIFYYVAQKIRYVAVELGPHTHKPHIAYEVFKNKYGDCKDKTTLLLTMLKIAGISAFPALIPSHEDIFDEAIPTMDVFNHIIAVIPKDEKDQYYWLDGTNEVAAFDSIPFYAQTKAFIINNDGSYKIVKTPASDDKKDYNETVAVYDINEDGDVKAEFNYNYYGKSAEGARYSFKYTSPEERKKHFEKQGIELSDIKYSSVDNPDEPFTINVKGTLKNYVQKLGEKNMVLTEIVLIDSYRDITSVKERKYPVSFNNSLFSKSKRIYKFPEGYKIKNLPSGYKRDDSYKKSFATYKFENGTFEVYTETKAFKYKINTNDFEDFKNHALDIQKYETSIKSILFERDE